MFVAARTEGRTGGGGWLTVPLEMGSAWQYHPTHLAPPGPHPHSWTAVCIRERTRTSRGVSHHHQCFWNHAEVQRSAFTANKEQSGPGSQNQLLLPLENAKAAVTKGHSAREQTDTPNLRLPTALSAGPAAWPSAIRPLPGSVHSVPRQQLQASQLGELPGPFRV